MITVVIPAYNSASTIKEAVDSVLVQGFDDYEIIIVDDKSSDNTVQVAESASICVNLWIKVLRSLQNSGPGAARNRGVAAAKGEWIAFLDADDAWLPDRLQVQMECVKQNPDVAMVCGGTIPFGNGSSVASPSRGKSGSSVASPSRETEEKRLVGLSTVGLAKADSLALPADLRADVLLGRASVPASRRLVLDEFVLNNPVATSTVLVRKEAISAVGGFDELFRGPEDYDLWMRLAARYPVIKLDVPLARYRRIPNSLSMNERTFLPQVIKVIDKAFGADGVFAGRPGKRKAIARQILAGSWSAADRGELWRASWLFLRSFAVWPFSFDGDSGLAWARVKLVIYFLKRIFCGVHVKCN